MKARRRRVAGAVAARERPRKDPGDRRRVDDVARALGDHDRVDGLDAKCEAAKIHIEHVVPVLDAVVLDQAAHGDTRVVKEVIDASRPLDNSIGRRA